MRFFNVHQIYPFLKKNELSEYFKSLFESVYESAAPIGGIEACNCCTFGKRCKTQDCSFCEIKYFW